MANPTPRKKPRKEKSKANEKQDADEVGRILANPNVICEEETITGEAAKKMYQALMNPPKDPEKAAMIKRAIKMFPKPTEPTIIDIDL